MSSKNRDVGYEILSVNDPNLDKGARKEQARQIRRLRKKHQRELNQERVNFIPGRRYDVGGAKREANFRGSLGVRGAPLMTTSFTAAAAYPFVASGTLGVPGVMIGVNELGGGAFCFDPWELYAAKIVKGMAMTVIGTVGTGKSTVVKSIVTRLVQAGRRALIMSDKKGEWVRVAKFLGGKTITVGSGLNVRINPLDEGLRPSKTADGEDMTDEAWKKMVRNRRLALISAVAEILLDRRMTASEIKAISTAVDQAVAAAAADGNRTPVIPDVLKQLNDPPKMGAGRRQLVTAYETLSDALSRVVEGDLEGMFDGESTIDFDPTEPIIVFNTQALEGMTNEARKIVYACTQSWAEAAVTSRDFGQRVMVYEEGLDALSDAGSLKRMVDQWKLARAYGIFNIIVLHKFADLDMAGDEGSKTRAQALSLVADSDIRVVYHQNPDQMQLTQDVLGLTARECEKVAALGEGVGLWKLGGKVSAIVRNTLTGPEIPVFDTDEKMQVRDYAAEAKAEEAAGDRDDAVAA